MPQGCKINAQTYEEHILEPVVKNLRRDMFQKGQFLFQQDGAPAHTSRRAQEWLRNNVPDFLAKEEWPPSSPDLNPMDFCVWSVLEKNVCRNPHSTVEALKRTPKREWANCTNDKPPQRGGAVPFPALGRVEMACQFPEGLILGRFSLGQLFSFFIPAVQCAVTCGQHS